MTERRLPRGLLAAAAALAIAALPPEPSLAVGDPPPPAPKPKPKPRTKTKPKPKESSRGDDQLYSLGYWQAKGGAYAAALATLRSANNPADPCIQTLIGFSLRKLGLLDEAMRTYWTVLAQYPERTTTRQYLGEAFLELGELGKAKEQLAEIARRCGTACEDYQLLADAIAKFEAKSG